jgi:phage terminase Nu1 subunit (DNA packaging protein)
LSSAKTALQEHRSADVLRAIDTHDAEFANGTLRTEAEVLRVLALCEVGREREAVERATKLRAEARLSPALSRLGGSCVEP